MDLTKNSNKKYMNYLLALGVIQKNDIKKLMRYPISNTCGNIATYFIQKYSSGKSINLLLLSQLIYYSFIEIDNKKIYKKFFRLVFFYSMKLRKLKLIYFLRWKEKSFKIFYSFSLNGSEYKFLPHYITKKEGKNIPNHKRAINRSCSNINDKTLKKFSKKITKTNMYYNKRNSRINKNKINIKKDLTNNKNHDNKIKKYNFSLIEMGLPNKNIKNKIKTILPTKLINDKNNYTLLNKKPFHFINDNTKYKNSYVLSLKTFSINHNDESLIQRNILKKEKFKLYDQELDLEMNCTFFPKTNRYSINSNIIKNNDDSCISNFSSKILDMPFYERLCSDKKKRESNLKKLKQEIVNDTIIKKLNQNKNLKRKSISVDEYLYRKKLNLIKIENDMLISAGITFRPHLNENYNNSVVKDSFFSRYNEYLSNKSIGKYKDELNQIKKDDKECTFEPKILENTNKVILPFKERLNEYQKKIDKKLNELKLKYQINYTFEPRISKNSNNSIKKNDQRSFINEKL